MARAPLAKLMARAVLAASLAGTVLVLQGCGNDPASGFLSETGNTNSTSQGSDVQPSRSSSNVAADVVPSVLAFVEQSGARVPAGGEVDLYAVSSSNAVWMTWVDQVHLLLERLGFRVPDRPAQQLHFESAPACDDAAELVGLRTARIGKPGWASWGFAYESTDDCNEDGFRQIAGHWVSCTNGWGCSNSSEGLIKPSEVAAAAAGSHATLLMNWVNDVKQVWTNYSCFNYAALDRLAVLNITLSNVKRLIRAIHARDADVMVLVVAVYPDAAELYVNATTLPIINDVNAIMRQGLQDEPNTAFVDYDFPVGEELYQTLHPGHPNCRGDRIIASAVVEALFRAGVLSRGIDLASAGECPAGPGCGGLRPSCCQRSGLCRLDETGKCTAYGPGRQETEDQP